jgi:hypothetical protein
LLSFLEVTLLLNWLVAFAYAPFPKKDIHTILDYFYWGNLLNNWAVAYMTGILLETGTTLAGIAISSLTGLSTIQLNDNPLTRSTSVADFWGIRWNRQVGSNLKHAFFKPLRKRGCPKSVAVMGTFLASGMLHEYVLLLTTLKCDSEGSVMNEPTYLRQTAFFMWNAIMLLIESILKENKQLQKYSSRLPRPVKTALVVMTVLPVSHLFVDEYVSSHFYADFVFAFPRIVKL